MILRDPITYERICVDPVFRNVYAWGMRTSDNRITIYTSNDANVQMDFLLKAGFNIDMFLIEQISTEEALFRELPGESED